MKTLFSLVASLGALLALGNASPAAVILPDLFADHMMLQANRPVSIWGKAEPYEAVTVTLNGQSARATAGADGNWSVTLPAQKAGGPYTVDIVGKNKIQLTDVLVGEVWLASGQSNMDMRVYPTPPWTAGVTDYEKVIAAANHPNLRIFTVFIEASEKSKDEIHGVWEVCSPATAGNFAAVAYFFAEKLHADLKAPVGIINSSVGATSISCWLDQDNVTQLPSAKRMLDATAKHLSENTAKLEDYRTKQLPAYYAKAREDRHTPGKLTKHPELYKGYTFQPSGCYNAMIAPLAGYPIKGFLWWQGESDSAGAAGYTAALKMLIDSWRAQWKEPTLPFLLVQISGRGPIPAKKGAPTGLATTDNWPKQRLAQAAVIDMVPHTAIAISCDLGDYNLVHFPRKQPVGERLARLALKMSYGFDIETHGPLAGKISAQGNSLVIPFDIGGGQLQGQGATSLAGFEVAGLEKIFHKATAKLDGDKVVVSAPAVQSPTIVRYGWAEFPAMSLFNTVGLPAPPFVREIGNDHAELDAINTPAQPAASK